MVGDAIRVRDTSIARARLNQIESGCGRLRNEGKRYGNNRPPRLAMHD